MTTQFLTINYSKTGFDTELTEIFKNKYTKVGEDGETLIVRAMNKSDIDMIYGKEVEEDKSLSWDDMIDIDMKYWLATEYDNYCLYYMSVSRYLMHASDTTYGVRPVVSLKPEVRVTTQDESGAWNIEMP